MTAKKNGESIVAKIIGSLAQASAETSSGKLPALRASNIHGLSVEIAPFGNTDTLVKPGMTIEIHAVTRHPIKGHAEASLQIRRPRTKKK